MSNKHERPEPRELFTAAHKEVWQQLGMTLQQFTTLLPGGANDREGFPGTLVVDGDEKSFKQRIKEQRDAEGWRRV